jgi:hypothetical protein
MNSLLDCLANAIGGILICLYAAFDLTNPVNWLALATALVGIGGLIAKPQALLSPRWLQVAPRWAYGLALIGPFVPLLVLYAMSWRYQAVMGYWPRDIVSDPSFHGDPRGIYECLDGSVLPSLAFAGWAHITVVALWFHLRGKLPARTLNGILAVAVLAGLLAGMDPTQRLMWWLD